MDKPTEQETQWVNWSKDQRSSNMSVRTHSSHIRLLSASEFMQSQAMVTQKRLKRKNQSVALGQGTLTSSDQS